MTSSAMHERRVPRMFYDYSGIGQAGQSRPPREPRTRLETDPPCAQRVAVDMSGRSTKDADESGRMWRMPVALAPLG